MQTLLALHAHPDDESSKAAGTVARASAAGFRCVLVTATGGEEGEILNPAMDQPGVQERLPEIRHNELLEAAQIIGYHEVVELGYRDSGMPDTEANARPDAFTNAPFEEVLERLVSLVRFYRPQVMLGYDDHERYPHPDHLLVHDLSLAVFDAAADGTRFPDAGEPWQIERLLAPVFTVRRVERLHQAALDAGYESPFARWIDSMDGTTDDGKPLMAVDVTDWLEVSRDALRAHRTQVDPDGFWFKLPTEMVAAAYPFDDFEVLRANTPLPVGADDLFAGL